MLDNKETPGWFWYYKLGAVNIVPSNLNELDAIHLSKELVALYAAREANVHASSEFSFHPNTICNAKRNNRVDATDNVYHSQPKVILLKQVGDR
jgi:hypothetical protein